LLAPNSYKDFIVHYQISETVHSIPNWKRLEWVMGF